MNTLLKKCVSLGTATLVWLSASRLVAQAPPIPGAPPPPAPGIPVVPAAPVAAPAQPMTLWSFLGISHENCDKCRKRLCDKPIGQMLNNMLLPFQFATGGLIHPLCPPLTPEDLAKLTDPNNLAVSPAEAVAAKIKADEATVKARIAAVRYLATVDCHYYPEVGDALIDMLRKDRNECVRFEAALALSRGCCCNKKTIAALIIVVSGEDKDGSPAETSERVKGMALHAMHLCMGRVPYFPDEPVRPEVPPEPELQPPESPVASALGSRVKLAAYYTHHLPKVPSDVLIQQAARLLAEAAGTSARPTATMGTRGGLMPMWYDANGLTGLREEISFDEAALQSPARLTGRVPHQQPAPRPAPGSVPPASQIQPVSGSTGPGPARISLGFQSGEVKKTPAAGQVGDGSGPAPVPWPIKDEPAPRPKASLFPPLFSFKTSPAEQRPQGQPASTQPAVTEPQPVPWPIGASSATTASATISRPL